MSSAVPADAALDVRDCVRKVGDASLDIIGERRPAAEFLGRLAQQHGHDALTQHIPTLLALLEDSNEKTRFVALEAFAHVGPLVLAQHIELLNELSSFAGHFLVRANSLTCMAGLAEADLAANICSVLNALEDAVGLVRERALNCLGRLPPELLCQHTNRVVAMLADESRSVCVEALHCLSKLPPHELAQHVDAIVPFKEHANDRWNQIRDAAIECLACVPLPHTRDSDSPPHTTELQPPLQPATPPLPELAACPSPEPCGQAQPSLLAVYRARQRAPPPVVPEKRKRSDFDSDMAYKQHTADRRRARERVREFNRPKRDRSGRDQSGRDQSGRARHARVREQREKRRQKLERWADEQEARESARMVRMGIVVPVGSKKAPRPWLDCV